MATSFVKLSDIIKGNNPALLVESPIEEKLLKEFTKFGIDCETQRKIGPYRADIYINTLYRKIVVECDGEAFHQDKEKDFNRDEYMRNIGILVERFTGSQINTNAQWCAMKVIEHISEVYSSQKYQDFLQNYLDKETIDPADPEEEISN